MHLIPLLTVSPIAHDNTSQLEKSQTTSTWGSKTTSTVGHPLDGSTKTGSAPTPSTFSKSAPLLFYTTLALISVFVISFLIYIFSYLRKFVISKREIKTSDLQIKNTGSSLYECVDFRHHMWKALLSIWENVLNEGKYSVHCDMTPYKSNFLECLFALCAFVSRYIYCLLYTTNFLSMLIYIDSNIAKLLN